MFFPALWTFSPRDESGNADQLISRPLYGHAMYGQSAGVSLSEGVLNGLPIVSARSENAITGMIRAEPSSLKFSAVAWSRCGASMQESN